MCVCARVCVCVCNGVGGRIEKQGGGGDVRVRGFVYVVYISMAQITHLDTLEKIDGHSQHRKVRSRAGTCLFDLAVRDDVEAKFVLTVDLVVVPGASQEREEGERWER